MFIFFLILLTAGAQDYASEVLYPDDLIPIEDLEGKIDFSDKIEFSIFYFRSDHRRTNADSTCHNNNNNNND